MATTPQGIPLTPDSVRISQLAKADREIAEKVDDLLAGELSPALAAAAAAAVAAEVADLDVVTGDDPRALGTITAADVALAVLDTEDRRTWLEVAHDGGPSAYAAQKIADTQAVSAAVGAAVGLEIIPAEDVPMVFGVVDSESRRTWLEVAHDGGPTAHTLAVLAAAGVGAGTASAGPAYPVDKWACWGDSLTAGHPTSGDFPTMLATALGVETYQGGWGGQRHDQIAARQGGTPARVSVTGGALPASGAVSLSKIIRTPLSDPGNRRGSIAGIPGTLARTGTAHTFTRTSPGAAVPVPAGSYFIPEDATARRDWINVLWNGNNSWRNIADFADGHIITPAEIIAAEQSMIDYLTPAVKRVMVLEFIPWQASDELGTGNRALLDSINNARAAAFAPYWVPLATWLRTDAAATAAGITWTVQDRADIAAGITPLSLRRDTGHFNTAGNTAITHRLITEARNRGWIY